MARQENTPRARILAKVREEGRVIESDGFLESSIQRANEKLEAFQTKNAVRASRAMRAASNCVVR